MEIEGDLKPLGTTFRSWLPIFGPIITIIGFIVVTSVFVQTAKTTNVLANNNCNRIELVERKDITTDNRISRLEEYYTDIKDKLQTLVNVQNTTNVRLSRIEDKLPR